MPADLTTLAVLSVLVLATVVRSAFGFGEALIAVPLLALVIPVEVAAPVAVLVSVTVAGLILLQDWREVHPGSAGRLILSTMFGIPIGLLILITVAEPVVKAVLAARLLRRVGQRSATHQNATAYGMVGCASLTHPTF